MLRLWNPPRVLPAKGAEILGELCGQELRQRAGDVGEHGGDCARDLGNAGDAGKSD